MKSARFARLLRLAEGALKEVTGDLPDRLQAQLARIPVLLENFPAPSRLAEGIESDQLGLFEGVGAEDPSSHEVPRITLWLGNLWDISDGDEEIFREEVRVTFLHELGHYLGLDEQDLEERDLG